MSATKLQRLAPENYITIPWKNGGGTSTTVAQQYRDDAPTGDWSSLSWQLGRTPIVAPAAFSDLQGFDRMQVLIKGSGLVLQTPRGEIDVRRPLQPVRFTGETAVVSKLENGPVEVVNLMAARKDVTIDLVVLQPGQKKLCVAGVHILYAPIADASVLIDRELISIPENHAIRVTGSVALEAGEGILLVASVMAVS